MSYEGLDPSQVERARDTRMHLELLVFMGKIDESLLQGKLLDFGAGWGTGTHALTRFGGDVEAVDISDAVLQIGEKGILPQDKVYHTDGLKFMRDRPGTYDVITAFMLGPLHDGKFAGEFYEAAQTALKSSGKIIVNSDLGSFQHIEALANHGKGEVLKYPGFPALFLAGKSSYNAEGLDEQIKKEII